MKHTSRPWTVDRTGDYYKKCIRRNGVIVCYLPHNVNNDSLLEAAPDMLEALEEIANHKQDSFTMTHSCEHDPMENYYDVKEIAGSAIRKAKGE